MNENVNGFYDLILKQDVIKLQEFIKQNTLNENTIALAYFFALNNDLDNSLQTLNTFFKSNNTKIIKCAAQKKLIIWNIFKEEAYALMKEKHNFKEHHPLIIAFKSNNYEVANDLLTNCKQYIDPHILRKSLYAAAERGFYKLLLLMNDKSKHNSKHKIKVLELLMDNGNGHVVQHCHTYFTSDISDEDFLILLEKASNYWNILRILIRSGIFNRIFKNSPDKIDDFYKEAYFIAKEEFERNKRLAKQTIDENKEKLCITTCLERAKINNQSLNQAVEAEVELILKNLHLNTFLLN